MTALAFASNLAAAQTNVVPDNTEFAALKALYDSLAGSGWTIKTNWPTPGNWPASATSAQFGTWYGVTVVNGDITQLNLPSNHLTGKTPQAIGNLAKLTKIYFYNNAINGSLPSTLNQLTNLTYLDYGINPITGTLPNLAALTNLVTLSLRSDGSLSSAPIPSWICTMTNLVTLDLNNAKRNGAIPAQIGNLVNLVTLDLGGNALTGPLPSSIGNLVNLVTLHIGGSPLGGALPSEIVPGKQLSPFKP